MAQAFPNLYLGIMSGTSLDGVDVVLTDLSQSQPRLIATHHVGFDAALRNELLALHQRRDNELERAALTANQLAEIYAQAVLELLVQTNNPAQHIAAIGCHGQTVRHRPELGYTLQLNNPALLAERTHIRVVAEFRTRDIAAGGQGAPLVPAFHAGAFQHASMPRAILNIGGIANLTYLPVHGNTIGFDCGPGNMLMDAWCQLHRHQPYDAAGAWAASGKAIPALLDRLLQEPYFQLAPPKSTGRDLFNLDWLQAQLQPEYAPQDVQATLLKLTVQSIHRAVQQSCPDTQEIYVCGGGAHNQALMNSLRHAFAPQAVPVALTDALGVAAQHVEAMAFAWLAKQTLQEAPGNLPAVTGARHPCVLGAIYPA